MKPALYNILFRVAKAADEWLWGYHPLFLQRPHEVFSPLPAAPNNYASCDAESKVRKRTKSKVQPMPKVPAIDDHDLIQRTAAEKR